MIILYDNIQFCKIIYEGGFYELDYCEKYSEKTMAGFSDSQRMGSKRKTRRQRYGVN